MGRDGAAEPHLASWRSRPQHQADREGGCIVCRRFLRKAKPPACDIWQGAVKFLKRGADLGLGREKRQGLGGGGAEVVAHSMARTRGISIRDGLDKGAMLALRMLAALNA